MIDIHSREGVPTAGPAEKTGELAEKPIDYPEATPFEETAVVQKNSEEITARGHASVPESAPAASPMKAWDDLRIKLEQSGEPEAVIETMQNQITHIKNSIDKNNLAEHLKSMGQPGSMDYNGVMRKIQKLAGQSVAEIFLKIYKRIIEQRINELESR